MAEGKGLRVGGEAGFIAAMAIWGTIGLFVRWIDAPSALIACARGFIGAGFLLAFLFTIGKGISPAAFHGKGLVLALSGALIGLNWVFLFEAYRYTTVAIATVCYYLAPIFVMLASPFAFRERLTLGKTACAAVAFAGMALVSGVLENGLPTLADSRGILCAVAAAVLYASVVLVNKRIEDVPAWDKTLVQLTSAALVTLPYVLLTVDFGGLELGASGLLFLLAVGVLHTGIAYALYFGSIPRMSAQRIAVLSYIDPVVAILLSAFVLAEPLGLAGAAGAALILGAAFLSGRL